MVAPLAAELLRILESERTFPPLSVESLGRVLYALGWSPLPTPEEITAALDELTAQGATEVVRSARLGLRYRIRRQAAVAAPPAA